jgi:RimJ/RimL family protein N-acetyltransferase
MLGSPTRVIETERLRVVPLSVEEAEAIVAGRRREAYAEGYPADGTFVAAAIVVASGGKLGPWTMYQARLRTDGRVVGGLGFVDPPDGDGRVRVGFSETEEAREQGYAAEALEALIAFAHHEGASRVTAETADPRFADVYTAAGMEQVAVCGGLRHFER